jgi:C4-dicarboxylate-specific signal transduction histidine kinase
LHNLIANAIDALTMTSDRPRELIVSGALDTPRFVRISVTDNGTGVPQDITAQLFRPFATSKPHGMGLGLAISRSIVEARGAVCGCNPSSAEACSASPCLSTARWNEQRDTGSGHLHRG